FKESPRLLPAWKRQAEKEGLSIRIGRWNIPGKPIAILVKFEDYYKQRDQIFTDIWTWFKVDSLRAFGDYDESCMFAWACGTVIRSFVTFNKLSGSNVVAHFDEWTTGMGLLYCKHFLPDVATVFTTHATSIGRSICGNNLPLYDFLSDYHGDQMARQLNMVSKHSLEKIAAQQADCFTTVSDITAKECAQLIEREPDVVTPNGFEPSFVKKGKVAEKARKEARKLLVTVTEALIGSELPDDTLFVGISGRYEMRNKGLDVFIDSLYQLQHQRTLQREVVGVIMVPANVTAPRQEVLERLNHPEIKQGGPIYCPFLTHWLNDVPTDRLMNMIRYRGFKNTPEEKVKLVFVPCYLNGEDGIFNKSYYDLLCGFDLTVFPSYYEPWGYTPLESIAFSVPTITTNLSGFGAWAIKQGDEKSISDGVAVINRTDHNYAAVVKEIVMNVLDVCRMSDSERSLINIRAGELSKKALWTGFIAEYEKAYSVAIKQNQKKNKSLTHR
ncbi:MAG: glycosyltransferase, partial [Bacteroidota bacterium]|nr:glycosyltransferase [Bacteroidota bacterium]